MWWWPATVVFLLSSVTFGCKVDSTGKQPLPNAVCGVINGTTAMKLFTTLDGLQPSWSTTKERVYEYVFGTFAVFVVFTAILVWGATRQTASNEKN